MSRLAYVNGRFRPMGDAAIRVEDRGFQFSDGVYEVWAVVSGRLRDAEGHFARLERSLSEMRIAPPMTREALAAAIKETLRRNRVRDGIVYLQITRGVAPRDHAFPEPAPKATVVITAAMRPKKSTAARIARGVRVITTPDIRWGRCDIKSVSLLPNVLAKQSAKEQGAQEAWLLDGDGFVTEGSSSNAWIITRDGVIVTRPLTANILAGITRTAVIEAAHALQIPVEERAFTVEEALSAAEAFITSANNPATSVIAIDGRPVGDGLPGPIVLRLSEVYLAGDGVGRE